MKLLATFKHISSKNADYGAAEAYLTFEHDEFTMRPTLDADGRLIPRDDYRIATLNCGEEDFAVACRESGDNGTCGLIFLPELFSPAIWVWQAEPCPPGGIPPPPLRS